MPHTWNSNNRVVRTPLVCSHVAGGLKNRRGMTDSHCVTSIRVISANLTHGRYSVRHILCLTHSLKNSRVESTLPEALESRG